MDDALRNGLWDAVMLAFALGDEAYGFRKRRNTTYAIAAALQQDFFKRPVDEIPVDFRAYIGRVRVYFMGCDWFSVYDFLEFVVANSGAGGRVRDAAQRVMEREMSAYRFVDSEIVKITDENEIASIEDAIGSSSTPVATHLDTALILLSDRSGRDYRNSVKESISAVEATVQRLIGEAGATLGQGLKKIEPRLPPALEKAISTLYGYTNDASGIRHALSDKPIVDFAEAKFILVVSTALVNFLRDRGGVDAL